MKYKVILDYSCFSVPASVRPKQGNTPNNSRKFYFVISKIHNFQYFKNYCQIHWFSLDLVKKCVVDQICPRIMKISNGIFGISFIYCCTLYSPIMKRFRPLSVLLCPYHNMLLRTPCPTHLQRQPHAGTENQTKRTKNR